MKRSRLQRANGRASRRGVVLGFLSLWLSFTTVASADGRDERERIVSVFHGPVVSVLANPDSDGHQLGDLRVVSLPTENRRGKTVGRLDATLITVSVDIPALNDETRISNLVFVFGPGTNQIVVNGTGFYPGAGGTIDLNSTLIRPVTGGSGRFAGATGWAETRHFPDDTWQHTFHLLLPELEDRDDDSDRRRRRRR